MEPSDGLSIFERVGSPPRPSRAAGLSDPAELQLLASKFAPIFILDEAEQYYPEDPINFIRASRFRHHRSGLMPGDQGWSKSSNEWITGNSHAEEFYDIPLSVINSYKAWANGHNRRPRDSNCGKSFNVFLEPKTHRQGVREPNGVVPCFYHSIESDQVPGIVAVIKYWVFHGYSEGVAGWNHQGDWESVAIALNLSLQPAFMSFSQHNEVKRIPWAEVLKKSTRPLSYIENGTHANFHQGRQGHVNGCKWDVVRKLESLEHQPWRDYAGAWGQVGNPGTDFTTGPLGPFYKPQY